MSQNTVKLSTMKHENVSERQKEGTLAPRGRELWRCSVTSEEDLEWSETGLNLPARICTKMTIHQKRKSEYSDQKWFTIYLNNTGHSE